MTCGASELMLHALIDGELDAARARQVEAHVRNCAHCAEALSAYGKMRHAIRPLRLSAPQSLRSRIEATLPSAPARISSRRGMLRGFAMGAALSGAIAASLVIAVIRTDEHQVLLDEVVSTHLRSLQSGHLLDVATSDQHTVKPWFNGRIGVAPPVVELASEGYPLAGGRLDYVGVRPVAVVVYRRERHVINLFVAASTAGSDERNARLEPAQGFNVVSWSARGLDFWAVSDIATKDLDGFVTKFKAASL